MSEPEGDDAFGALSRQQPDLVGACDQPPPRRESMATSPPASSPETELARTQSFPSMTSSDEPQGLALETTALPQGSSNRRGGTGSSSGSSEGTADTAAERPLQSAQAVSPSTEGSSSAAPAVVTIATRASRDSEHAAAAQSFLYGDDRPVVAVDLDRASLWEQTVDSLGDYADEKFSDEETWNTESPEGG